MLIKEYRIPLPLTVEEYQIAQLYMIAKKSREESKGAENGVEILVNEPYDNGPGGSGQYTHKIYHISSYLPGWFKSLLPISRLAVEEKAYNSYPYTKTSYSCPLVQRFSVEIETLYFADGGNQDNVFGLSGSELRNRTVDVIDIVKDQQMYAAEYLKEEDPVLFVSQKTKRGPLGDDWIEEYSQECQGKAMPLSDGKAIMTAYKLCKVELHIWGMQTKLENYIHSVGLRKIMFRAHRQAWAWQDEWVNLTMDDIREIERQTQESLKRKMASDQETDESGDEANTRKSSNASIEAIEPKDSALVSSKSSTYTLCEENPQSVVLAETASHAQISLTDISGTGIAGEGLLRPKKVKSRSRASSNAAITSSCTSPKNYELLASLRVESLMRKQSESESEDEFFDCMDNEEGISLTKWSSMENIQCDDQPGQASDVGEDSIFSQPFLQRITAEREKLQGRKLAPKVSVDDLLPGTPTIITSSSTSCRTTVVCLVFHAGSVLDSVVDIQAKKSDVTTFKGTFESVVRQHYPSMLGHVAIKMVPCPSVCTESLGVLTSLSPYSFDVYGSGDSPQMTNESVPVGAIPLFVSSQPEYWEAVAKAASAANQTYQDFLGSAAGHGFNGQVVVIGDSMGSVLAYDVLSKAHVVTEEDLPPSPGDLDRGRSPLFTSNFRRRSSSVSDPDGIKLDFEVTDFFIFGSPLPMVLAHRKMQSEEKNLTLARPCQQLYNLFHPTDPLAIRMEPLISASFAAIPPVNVARYNKYPLGDGQPYHLLTHKWWGNKRIDYALYCPESLANFPTNSLPHLFHASYWESADAIAFILRQIGVQDSNSSLNRESKEIRSFCPPNPREKWVKKRTSVKLKNLSANHRANDVIVMEGHSVLFKARFMYGPLDMVSLSGEKVDVYIMKDPPAGEWVHVAEETTDKNGRVCHTVGGNQNLSYGIYPIKIIVRGDHTCVDFYCAIVPPKTECVVFSIDGSFTASVSVTGKDPRVRPGAVDVTRHWQELGYLIIYVTGRPDMQHHKVVSWLAQHNFPHGLVSFADGLSTDFLAHKIEFLRSLVNEQRLIIHAAYGSSKDIAVYSSVGVPPEQIFIIGKVSKKQHGLATILCDGYSDHLVMLMSHGGSRPAHGNSRMVIPRGYFGLPGQSVTIRRQRSTKRPNAFPLLPVEGGTLSGQDLSRELSASPRLSKSSLSGGKLV